MRHSNISVVSRQNSWCALIQKICVGCVLFISIAAQARMSSNVKDFDGEIQFISRFSSSSYSDDYASGIRPWDSVSLMKRKKPTGTPFFQLSFNKEFSSSGYYFTYDSEIQVSVNGSRVTTLPRFSDNTDLEFGAFIADSLVSHLSPTNTVIFRATSYRGYTDWTVPSYVLQEWLMLATADINLPLGQAVFPVAGIDTFDGSTVNGWVYDPKDSTVSVDVHFYIDGTLSSVVTPFIERTDLPTIGATHGFSFTIPPQEPGTHNVEAYAINTDTTGINPVIWNYEFTIPEEISVSSVSPLSTTQNETVTFTISGENFPQSLNISIADCAPVQTAAPETCTATQCQHTCTTSSADSKPGTVKDSAGNLLFSFNVDVQAAPVEILQCAVFAADANPQVSIPCVQVGTDVFSAGMNIVPAPGLRFAVDVNTLAPAAVTPGNECAVFPHNGGLRLNCVDVGGTKLWVDLDLVPNPAAIEFDLVDFGNRQ